MGQQEKTAQVEVDGGVVAYAMTEIVTVPLRDLPATGAAPIDLRTTQVWHRSDLEAAAMATPDTTDLPIVDVPVPRAAEQTMIIRRPPRRRHFDWHAPIGLAASAGVLAVMVALADWSERHPAQAPVSARPEGDGKRPSEPAAAVNVAPSFVLEALEPQGDHGPPPGGERTGRRASSGHAPARGEAGRVGTKTRARPNGHGAVPGTRGGRVPPPRPAKDNEDASTYSGGSAIAHSSARPRATSGNRAIASSAWVDPFASY